MHQVIVKYKSAKALKALRDLARIFDMVIESDASENTPAVRDEPVSLPITFAENPDFKALAGVWVDKEIDLKELRKQAWGNRF